MAQFYYEYAVRNPTINDDGTMTIQFISKINYVVASSLVTCDTLCEMHNVTFNMFNGSKYSETTSYAHDRRFYFSADPNVQGPKYWETPSDSKWRGIDDDYDNSVICVEAIINHSPFSNNPENKVSAELLASAYRLKIKSEELYQRIVAQNSNNSNNGNTSNNDDIEPFLTNALYNEAGFDHLIQNNLNCQEIANAQIVSANFVGQNPGTGFVAYGGQPSYGTHMNDVPILHTNAVSNLSLYLSSMVGCSNAYWNYQITLPDQQIDVNLYSNYFLTGCTYVDGTAGGGLDPIVAGDESDFRKEVNFPTTEIIDRCKKHFMDMGQCLDISNITNIIEAYSIQQPDTHIKAIKSIKPKGQNVCQFMWDEVKVDPVSQIETNYSNVTNNILYQIDISSCTFCLPKDSTGIRKLYGTTVNSNIQSDTLSPPPAGVLMYNNPVGSNSPNYNDHLAGLIYKKAYYILPITGNASGSNPQTEGIIINTVTIPDVDDIKRFYPSDGTQLPDLIRPKAPIRIRYPKAPEKALGNQSNDLCSLPQNMENFILDYNSANKTNKITKIVRAYTTSSNICDMEVDILVGNNVQRKTLSYNMKREGFQTYQTETAFENLAAYTYDSLIPSQQGLNIQKDTHGLPGVLSTIGFGFTKPYLSNLAPAIAANNIYFNDDLIKNFTATTVGLKNTTNRLLVDLAGTQHLGTSNCTNKCDDPEIRQRIIEQYNIDGYPKTRLDVSQNTMLNIVAAATASSNKCHLVFENQNDSIFFSLADKIDSASITHKEYRSENATSTAR
jgi:hypothetical protein